MTMTDGATASIAGTAKYLTFALGEEQYGLQILKVREIIGYTHITAMPRASGYIEGVINLRGRVIPVLDLRKRLGMAAAATTRHTCIIVVEKTDEGRRVDIGLIVDRVLEVLVIDGKDVEAPPAFGPSISNSFIFGLGKFGNQPVKILLNIDNVLAAAEERP